MRASQLLPGTHSIDGCAHCAKRAAIGCFQVIQEHPGYHLGRSGSWHPSKDRDVHCKCQGAVMTFVICGAPSCHDR